MQKYEAHPGYSIINGSQELMETALFARYFYRDYPYHNFGHVLNSLVYAQVEMGRYHMHEPDLLPVNGIYKALLLHDTLVHQPLTEPFATKEERSASLAGYMLREMGDTEDEITNIKRWIMNTNPNYPCADDAGRIVCRADIGNTADEMSVFVREFINVYIENKIVKFREGRPQDIVNPLVAARDSVDFLKLYFRQDLALGSGDWDRQRGVSIFVRKALANFTKLPQTVAALPTDAFEVSEPEF